MEPPSPAKGSVLARIYEDDLTDDSSVDASKANITECTEVASFNLLNEKEPTILVPGWWCIISGMGEDVLTQTHVGKPPAWTPLQDPTSLKEDDGLYFRDINAARFPSFPTQPYVEAILKQNPKFDTENVRIVTCGSSFGNLLRFVRKIDREFRIIVESIGSTVFITRRENSPTQTIPGVHGFGHTFPESYTTWPADVKGSDSHQRVIQYLFGGMKCLVRFEADGYLPESLSTVTESSTLHATSDNRNIDPDHELASAILNTTLGTRNTDSTDGKALNIRTAGTSIPHAALFELKTRSIRKKDQDVLGEELPRLWVSQIPHFVLAFHSNGMFSPDNISIRNVQDAAKDWEKENQDALYQLAVLLEFIVAFAKDRPDGRFEIVHEENGRSLDFREVLGDVNRTLPEELSSLWAGNKTEKADSIDNQKDDRAGCEYLESDSESDEDYTACTAGCGYCGHCKY